MRGPLPRIGLHAHDHAGLGFGGRAFHGDVAAELAEIVRYAGYLLLCAGYVLGAIAMQIACWLRAGRRGDGSG